MDRQFQITLPGDVAYIIHQIEQAGFEAFAVGGCIRDSILGRQPNDWDITTSALPQQVKAIFKKTIDTGIAHGTVTVMRNHIGYEVTTYRIDGEYEDSRHPKEVSFTAKLEEDLKRRDFTINAMAYNPEQGVIDIFGGQEDLKRGIIRCVGNPHDRFGEDALRMLRAVRFAAQLGFEIEPQTLTAIRDLAEKTRSETENIASILEELSENANDAADAVHSSIDAVNAQDTMIEQASDSFATMNDNVNSLISEIENIDSMLGSLSDSNNQIVDHISNLSATTEEVTASSAQAADLSVENLDNAETAKQQLDSVLTVSHKLDKYIRS